MEKLELKHLAGYLPYHLKLKTIDILENDPVFTLTIKEGGRRNASIDWVMREPECFKPILRPFSDLTKEIEVNGEKFVPYEMLAEIEEAVTCRYSLEFFENCATELPYWIIQKLYEWHFDINGLIEKELAVDINTLKE